MLWYSRKIFAGTSFIKSTAKGIEAIVMEILISLSAALIGGLLMSRLAKRLHLPAVTAYLVAGLLLGPFFIGLLGIPGLGFSSMESVERLNILSQVALGFIAFTIGNEFRVSQLNPAGGDFRFLRHYAGSHSRRYSPRRNIDGGPAVQGGRPYDTAAADGGGD